jgi:hypothetical protein
MFNPSTGPVGPDKVHPVLKDRWKKLMKKFRDTKYYPSGERIVDKYYCKISNTKDGKEYTVPGSFMPNRLTSDSNANRRLDIFRCKMNNIDNEFKNLIRSHHAVHVTLVRLNESVTNFTVPWSTRKTGFLLHSPPSDEKFDVWRGFDADLSLKHNIDFKPNTEADSVHICVSGVRQLPSKRALPVILEFVSHHLNIGVEHIYLPISVGWTSDHMKRFIGVFQSYIDEGRVSVYSQAGDSLAISAFEAIAEWLGAGIASLAVAVDPACVVIGGGVIEAGELLMRPMLESFKRNMPFVNDHPAPKFYLAQLGNDAGMVGAADLARN